MRVLRILGKKFPLFRLQRGHAGAGIDIRAGRVARVDMRHHRLLAARGRVEIGVEHAAAIGELQLAHRGLANVEPGRAEQLGQAARVRSHQRPLFLEGAGRRAGGRRGVAAPGHDRSATGGERRQQQKRQETGGNHDLVFRPSSI